MEDYKSNKKELKIFRKTLRNNLTPAEATLWKHIKNKQIYNVQWRRQFSVGPYILDFYCPKARLAIELDGKEHYTIEGDKYDCERDIFISSKGIKILRYENKDIWESFKRVVEEINKELQHRING